MTMKIVLWHHTVKSGRKFLAFRSMQLGSESISEITRPCTPKDDISMYTCHSAYLSCPVSLRVKLQKPRLLSTGGRMTRRVKAEVWGGWGLVTPELVRSESPITS